MYKQKATSCKKAEGRSKIIERELKKTKKILITKERTKEHRERITRGESPSPRSAKKGAAKRSKQLVVRAFHVLKHPPILLPPNTPH